MESVAFVRSVNIGTATPTEFSEPGVTGIDKRSVAGPVEVSAPAQGGGLAGDAICDLRNHGGPEQAVYAYAWEDLARWAAELGRALRPGEFGENLTTEGLDVNGAVIGERWLVGETLLLEVSVPRIPCRTFAGWLDERGWVKRFTQRALPGAYLRVLRDGAVCAGDAVRVVHRPSHGLDVATTFRALTGEPELLHRLVDVAELPVATRERAARRLADRRAVS
ncbi:MOSC domain-containing protein YiiM [Kitasatospora sp. GAS204A]|uniref:MOSC domain-containing protein n=1 Tax=unclassified Kitasatospora TaxID=2633591 RepID=UPI002473AE02|nr:MOSC domain-containing protein [Kitasatospora sp. GAS204B]MDH6119636.1 MOSC domain-containing protein YiiM [Kitasatospora sp. GAS204B]